MQAAKDSGNFSGCVARPYWHDGVAAREIAPAPLPANVDLLVVGSGYTGLSAAIEAAKGGLSVLVLDREQIGFGCSTRNGGQVATSIKPSLSDLSKKHGPELASAIRSEGDAALEYVDSFIAEHAIDCNWERRGRYLAAHTQGQYDALARRAEAAQKAGERLAPFTVPKERQTEELASDRYFGGLVNPGFGSVQPAKLHAGMVDVALKAGIRLRGHCGVSATRRAGQSGFTVVTAGGELAAKHVLLATNGYTGDLSPWQKRRVIPIGSYMLATEELPEDLAASLIPKGRMVVDTRNEVIYFRMSPDGRRMIFGGRAGLMETDAMKCLPRLYGMMTAVFPQLNGTRVTHAWNGFVAYTFDTLPHMGVHEGVHYAMGYCGSGVSLSLYFGMRAGQKIRGLAEGRTALDDLPFQTRPLYGGKPWFLAPSILAYRLIDRLTG